MVYSNIQMFYYLNLHGDLLKTTIEWKFLKNLFKSFQSILTRFLEVLAKFSNYYLTRFFIYVKIYKYDDVDESSERKIIQDLAENTNSFIKLRTKIEQFQKHHLTI